ncbi:alpha/beta hydrolase-fold protein [Kitasatospora sp. NBC_01250]|uniref:alpha/beta hydrolase n=1 Tax=Kitasatospora sp. NBC_01250 TaxID=2903571 RepID=UPI002E31E6BA|nr:alpha/beta hydrolase-fold protein [Kitasatospora sp. NBC_01250]
MALTGTPFFILTIVLFVGSIALAMVQWLSRGNGAGGNAGAAPRAAGRRKRSGGGTGPVRTVGFFATILFSQATAIALVFVMVNNDNQLYGSWGDLLGTSNHVRSVPVPPKDNGLAGDQAAAAASPGASAPAKVLAKFKEPDSDAVPRDVKQTDLNGKLSGVEGEVLVWTPPQYDDPAYKDKSFPVVELLVGYPGSSSAWYGKSGMNVTNQLGPLMKSGQVTPFILVSPRFNLLPNNQDSGCADIPGKVNAETWLTRDVPQMVLDNFRAQDTASGWAVAGYSAGGHCATRLVIGHPDRYRAAISMSGYNNPQNEADSLVGKDPQLNQADNPLNMLTRATTPPNIGLWLSGGQGADGLPDAQALKQAAKAPTAVTVTETAGGHLTSVWSQQVVPAFKWLSGIIPAPK